MVFWRLIVDRSDSSPPQSPPELCRWRLRSQPVRTERHTGRLPAFLLSLRRTPSRASTEPAWRPRPRGRSSRSPCLNPNQQGTAWGPPSAAALEREHTTTQGSRSHIWKQWDWKHKQFTEQLGTWWLSPSEEYVYFAADTPLRRKDPVWPLPQWCHTMINDLLERPVDTNTHVGACC